MNFLRPIGHFSRNCLELKELASLAEATGKERSSNAPGKECRVAAKDGMRCYCRLELNEEKRRQSIEAVEENQAHAGGKNLEGKKWRGKVGILEDLRSEIGNKRGESGSDLGIRVWGKVGAALNRQEVGGLGLVLGQNFVKRFAYFYFDEQQNIFI